MKEINLLYMEMMDTKRTVPSVFEVALLVVAMLSACSEDEVGGGSTGGGCMLLWPFCLYMASRYGCSCWAC